MPATDPFGDNVPSFDLGTFQFGVVSNGPPSERVTELAELKDKLKDELKPKVKKAPKLGVLGLLESRTFKGPGFNTIFRPHSHKQLEDEVPIKGNPSSDNDLQLNLTVETIAFAESIGRIPNRGLMDQADIPLGGIQYTQTVFDVTNEATGRADLPAEEATGIHVETGFWMAVPEAPNSGAPKDTLCRMASIPHGTTINAQGLQPSLTPIAGPPGFEEISITPFGIGSAPPPKGTRIFKSQTLENINSNRIPSDLDKFKANKTITQTILDNPNKVLENAIKVQEIVNFIPFEVTTEKTRNLDGGGTSNIAFLGPDPRAPTPQQSSEQQPSEQQPSEQQPSERITNAIVPSVKATFWIETVEYKFTVHGGEERETIKKPSGDFGPTFKVPPTIGRTGDIPFTVHYLQLQYSQTVLLNFAGLSWPHVSVATLGEQTTYNLVLPPETTTSVGDPRHEKGEWGTTFELQNCAVHASVLPTGKVLYWGRRSNLADTDFNQHSTKTFIWDPKDGETSKGEITKTSPSLTSGNPVNLFCSGHCFQPDGNLLVVGGHLEDGHGVNQACVYDPFKDTWTAKPRMNNGRWYPSALAMSDGSTLAISGSYYDDTDNSTPMNDIPQIWRKNTWVSMPRMNNTILQSFPCLHLDPHGRVFMAGPQGQSEFLDVSADDGIGAWTIDGPKLGRGTTRDYGPSVMYDSGQVIYIGGGDPPTLAAECIDLNDANPAWTATENMNSKRRQHNATVLPDGTVLVTGGTSGDGFNDEKAAVHEAELWDPLTGKWKKMAAESVDRCYHSIALLLPDGRVLSAGGGEGANAKLHTDAQLYKPPYFFTNTPRPIIKKAPLDVEYGQRFEVLLDANDLIDRVSWVRLGSVTHSTNMNQSLMFLEFHQRSTKVLVHAPADAYVAPPGHYMLFLLSKAGVPSLASIICIGPVPESLPPRRSVAYAQSTARPEDYALSLPARNEKIIAEQDRAAVAVGITPSCPYGLGSCWGAAFDGLRNISDIDIIRPVPDQANSIAYVYLKEDILPDLEVWRKEFEQSANKLYEIRGIEVTLSGPVSRHHIGTDEQLILSGTKTKDDVVLAPFYQSSKLEWDKDKKESKPASDAELSAWADLSAKVPPGPDPNVSPIRVNVKGRLHQNGPHKFSLDVREWSLSNIGKPNGV